MYQRASSRRSAMSIVARAALNRCPLTRQRRAPPNILAAFGEMPRAVPRGGRQPHDRARVAWRQLCARLVVVLVAFASVQCAPSRDSQVPPDIIHPHVPDLKRPHAPDRRIPSAEPLGGTTGGLLRSFAAARPLATIGRPDGPMEQILGKIEDIAVDSAGRVFILDSHFSQVRIFTAEGVFLGSVGGVGQGPGELRKPLSLTVDAGGVLYVGGIDRRIVTYAPTPNGYAPAKVFHLPVAPRDMCWMGQVLVVHGVDSDTGATIHRYSSDGVSLGSFGTVYSTRNPMIMSQVSQGTVACVPEKNLVLFAPKSVLPEVRAYSLTGELTWIVELALSAD